MIIDPLEAVITWLENALTSAGGRVAGKHRYGGGWAEDKTGVSVHMDGGPADLYAKVATPRLEIRIYADDQVKVVDIWRELVKLSRENERFTVATSKGNALVHYVKPETMLSLIHDEVINKDLGIVFMMSMISEEAIL